MFYDENQLIHTMGVSDSADFTFSKRQITIIVSKLEILRVSHYTKTTFNKESTSIKITNINFFPCQTQYLMRKISS